MSNFTLIYQLGDTAWTILNNMGCVPLLANNLLVQGNFCVHRLKCNNIKADVNKNCPMT